MDSEYTRSHSTFSASNRNRDTLSGVTWEIITTCPPNLQRTFPTFLYWAFVVLCLVGSGLGMSIGNNMVEPSFFIKLTYNGFGSLLVLICSIWAMDALYLAYLFLVADKLQGRKGAAQDWWYRNILSNNETVNEPPSVDTTVQSGDFEEETVDDNKAHDTKQAENRRSARVRLAIILVLYIWWTTWSYNAGHNPNTLELSIPVPRLPPQCDGYRLAMASDLHVGSMAGIKDAEWMVEKLNGLEPDAIALVGDIGDQPVNNVIRDKMRPLASLKAPDGVFMTFGNHENSNGIAGFRKLLREESPFAESSLTILENEHAILTKENTDGCSIALIGMADWSGKAGIYSDAVAPDYEKAIRSQHGPNGSTIDAGEPVSSDLPMIMMQHQPHGMKQAATDGIGLQLSGHTHGGQIFPQHITLLGYDGISGLAEFDVGSEHGPSYLFVSEGVVGWGPRLRFLSQTDIALLTLRTPEAMKEEGLVPDLSASVATIAMYFAIVILPISVLMCLVPFCCWLRKSSCSDDEEDFDDLTLKVKEELQDIDL
mmetsp:Transcript_33177/g.80200  ORF Transcript_33177/g.80200 Transcript_33177/m.80200 type:complete len:540 (+) Transcript_33177:500-2119(+)